MAEEGKLGGPFRRVEPLVERLIAHIRDYEPIEATRLGLTERDGDLPDLGLEALEARARSLTDLEAAVLLERAALPPHPVGEEREAAADLGLLLDTVRWRRTELVDRPRFALDPLAALETVAAGVLDLLHDESGNAEAQRQRAHAAVQRTRRIPVLLEQAGALLAGLSSPAFDVASQRLPSLIRLVRDTLPAHVAGLGLEVDAARDAGEYAAEGLEAFGALLDELVDDRRLDWRVGPVHHERALRLSVGTTMDAQTIEDRARTVLEECRADMIELAAAGWQRRFPGERRPSDPMEVLRLVLDAIAQTAVEPHRLIAEARQALDEAQAFVADWDALDAPPAEELRFEPMPEDLQGIAVAFITRPPPLRPEVGSAYNLSPVPRSWDDARKRSFLREYHPAMLRSLAVHEGYPGHYLQLAHAARHPRLVRRLVTRPVFAEGWAVMMERVTLEAGFGRDATSRVAFDDLLLTQRKMELRVAANALLDLGLHAASMTDEDAMSLMTGAAMQQEAEARGKLQRAKVTSAQLCSYFAGSEELAALRRSEEQRLGTAFDLGRFLRQVLSHGTPTVAMVAEALADGATERRPFAQAAAPSEVPQGR